MSELSIKAQPGCDSECYVRHHMCAVREVRRLRALLDTLTEAPKEDRDRYDLLHMRLGWAYEDLSRANQRIKELEDAHALHDDSKDVVPASWLARANKRIGELTDQLLLRAKP